MHIEQKKLIYSIIPPLLFVSVLWLIKIVEWTGDFSLSFLGVYPLKAEGLIGIVTAPLIHGDFSHLAANSLPLLILGSSLIFFYRDISLKVFLLIYLITGLWVWVFAREAYHIGASGVVYGLATFIFVSGIIRRNARLSALAMVIAFLYGSFVWGIFPEFFPERNISWESHLMGIIAGLILAIYFRKEGPQREKYSWEFEEEAELLDEDDEEAEDGAYWNTTLSDEEIKNIKHVYRYRRKR
jgi:membrane associated rhomboid family serine protease